MFPFQEMSGVNELHSRPFHCQNHFITVFNQMQGTGIIEGDSSLHSMSLTSVSLFCSCLISLVDLMTNDTGPFFSMIL